MARSLPGKLFLTFYYSQCPGQYQAISAVTQGGRAGGRSEVFDSGGVEDFKTVSVKPQDLPL
jgi:hypothetical protein